MQLGNELSGEVAINATAGAAGTTDIEGAVCDMQNYEGVLMVVTMGAIVGNAVTSIKAQQDSAVGMGTAADLAGTKQVVADSDDEEVFIIDVHRPILRYVRLYVDRATQNATCTAMYFKYGGRKRPDTQGAGVNLEIHVSPIEGTA